MEKAKPFTGKITYCFGSTGNIVKTNADKTDCFRKTLIKADFSIEKLKNLVKFALSILIHIRTNN